MATPPSYAVPDLVAEVSRLMIEHPMADAVIEEIDGRRIQVDGHWLVDFASCNYLGLDLDLEVITQVPAYLARWGTPSQLGQGDRQPRALPAGRVGGQRAARGRGHPRLPDPDPHTHNGVLPALAGEGTVLLDTRAHRTIQDAATIAAARGATVRRFRAGDVEHARRLLQGPLKGPRLLCMDGINSMTGNPPDLPAFAALAREHDALLYLDDAHGFGIIGERDGYDPTPYGRRGNAIVRWFGESYDRIVLTAGFSKAYSSLLAFVTCSDELKRYLKATVPSYVYSGPVPVASLATALAGLEVNQRRGDELRAQLWHRTRTLLDHLDKLGVATTNTSGLPLVELAVADPADLDAVGRHLFDRGIYVTLAPYPVVPRQEAGFRIQLTAAHSPEQVDHLLLVLQEVDDRYGFRRPHP